MKRRILNRDWTHLKGREINIEIKYDEGIERKKGKLSEIEFDLGITIHHFIDKNRYLYCLRSPFVMKKKKSPHKYNQKEYRKEFRFIVEGIEKGKIIFDLTDINKNKYGNNPSSNICAFT